MNRWLSSVDNFQIPHEPKILALLIDLQICISIFILFNFGHYWVVIYHYYYYHYNCNINVFNLFCSIFKLLTGQVFKSNIDCSFPYVKKCSALFEFCVNQYFTIWPANDSKTEYIKLKNVNVVGKMIINHNTVSSFAFGFLHVRIKLPTSIFQNNNNNIVCLLVCLVTFASNIWVWRFPLMRCETTFSGKMDEVIDVKSDPTMVIQISGCIRYSSWCWYRSTWNMVCSGFG